MQAMSTRTRGSKSRPESSLGSVHPCGTAPLRRLTQRPTTPVRDMLRRLGMSCPRTNQPCIRNIPFFCRLASYLTCSFTISVPHCPVSSPPALTCCSMAPREPSPAAPWRPVSPHLLQHLVEAEGHVLERQLAGLHLAEVEDVVEHRHETIRRGLHQRQQRGLLLVEGGEVQEVEGAKDAWGGGEGRGGGCGEEVPRKVGRQTMQSRASCIADRVLTCSGCNRRARNGWTEDGRETARCDTPGFTAPKRDQHAYG